MFSTSYPHKKGNKKYGLCLPNIKHILTTDRKLLLLIPHILTSG